MALPPWPPAEPGGPGRRRRPPAWILFTVAAVVLAGAVLGTAVLVGNRINGALSSRPQSAKINNNGGTSGNGTGQRQGSHGPQSHGPQSQGQAAQSQGQRQAGQGQAGQSGGQAAQSGSRDGGSRAGRSQRQSVPRRAVIVPYGPTWHRGRTVRQHVRVYIDNKIIVRIKIIVRGGGWYVITGPCRYRRAAGGCTGRYLGTIRPLGYGGGGPKAPMNRPQRPAPSPPPVTAPSGPSPQPPGQPSRPSGQPSRPSGQPSQPSAPASPSTQPSQPSPSAPTGFLVPSALAQSVATEQTNALATAPSSSYTSPDNATVTVTCTSMGNDQFSCTATDSDGDTGAADLVTVAANGSSWTDSGMTWTGPDVTGAYTTPAASARAAP